MFCVCCVAARGTTAGLTASALEIVSGSIPSAGTSASVFGALALPERVAAEQRSEG